MLASRVESEGRVALPPCVSNPILPLDDHTGYVHLLEPSGYLKAGLRGADYNKDFSRLFWNGTMAYGYTHR